MSSDQDDRRGRIKCVVWDLDNTLWDGVLLEGDACELRPDAAQALELLDRRGILQSISSKNDSEAARGHLEQSGRGAVAAEVPGELRDRLPHFERHQSSDTGQQPGAVPWRRRAAQHQPRGKDQRDVVVLVKVEREGKRTHDARGEHNIQVGPPAPGDG